LPNVLWKWASTSPLGDQPRSFLMRVLS
jgi:hypothetical protein